MAKITSGSTFGLTAPQTQAARLLAEGKSDEEVMLAVFGGDGTEACARKNRKKLTEWKRMDEFVKCFRAIVNESGMGLYGRAMGKMVEQLDNKNPWVAQTAAREILTRFTPSLMGTEDKTVNVRVEGMPQLGTPPPDEG